MRKQGEKINAPFYALTAEELRSWYKERMITASGYLFSIKNILTPPGKDFTIPNVVKFCEEWGIGRSAFYKAVNDLTAKGYLTWRATHGIILTNSDKVVPIPTSPNGQVSPIVDAVSTNVDSVSPIVDAVSTNVDSDIYIDRARVQSITEIIEITDPPIAPQDIGGGGDGVSATLSEQKQNQSALTQNDFFSCQTEEPLPDKEILPLDQNVPAHENHSQIKKTSRIREIFEETGKVLNYGVEYQQWISSEMGDVMGHYRRSGRALDRSPNDISLEFKSHVSVRANNGKGLEIHSVERWILNCEKDPHRWAELRSLVAAWLLTKRTGDRHLNIAQEVERSSRPPINLKLDF